MTVCIVGSGAREHALAEVLSRTHDVIATPGNPGIAGTSATGHTITSTEALPEEIEADLFVVGPEAPLVDGLGDRLRAKGQLVFGPSADGAQLEGSKAFMKQLAADAGVPTADFRVVEHIDQAIDFFKSQSAPYVIKTDGLAAGKGVFVTENIDEAIADAAAKLGGDSFGDAGRRLVVEEGMRGPEVSLLVLCDGKKAIYLPPARDYKRVGDGDTGPNTGGMGAFSSEEAASQEVIDEIMERIVLPTVSELRRRGIDYRGVLYAGCMLTDEGPKLIEYNVRFGDPEAEVVLPRLDGDVAQLLADAADGRLGDMPKLSSDAAACVVLTAEGYPVSPRYGDVITGIERASTINDVMVFHGGTRLGPDGSLLTHGGRVLTVSALGANLSDARARAYQAVQEISFAGMQFRHDIADVGDHNGGMGNSPRNNSATSTRTTA